MLASGFDDLIPVIPPGAALAPSSKITQESIGKIPGRRLDNGLWVGYDWRKGIATLEDVRRWARWGANVGLRTDVFPCVDIDCADPRLAETIEGVALATLGAAPIRTGNAPKRVLAYRLELNEKPFGRLRLWMGKGDEKQYLVEVLGAGQQYVVHGVHPKTQRPYAWDREPRAGELVTVTLEKAKAFIEAVKETAEMLGYDCKTEGDGAGVATRRADQDSLLAPSMDALRTVVDLLPNDDSIAPGRHEWLKIGAAIKASAGEVEEREAADLFIAWSMKWGGNDRADGNDPDDSRENFRRLKPPFAVGWSWLAELARDHGYDDSPFEADEAGDEELTADSGGKPTAGEPAGPKFLSEQWLAQKVVRAQRGILRYLPEKDQWLVWNKGRWNPDAEMMAEDTIKMELRRIAAWVDGFSGSDGEFKQGSKRAEEICSSGKLSAVARLVKLDRAIAVGIGSLDHDPWILNTPGGIVDLKTGKLLPADPDQLCTRSTSVTPEQAPAPLWEKFLADASSKNPELVGFLQRWAGYCLTGVTYEHKYGFIYGEGGRGKGTFINVMMGVLASYHKDSPMETFVASHNDRHPTELAALAGARLVTASETEAGKRWDEAKLKRMTGGDPITARAMREDFFTYRPQFKLTFMGNYRPEIRNLDFAMQRRTLLIPFDHKPATPDLRLGEKLEAEYPQILAWMIEGCLAWQRDGLQPPKVVLAATDDYFVESDPFGQWLDECTDKAKPTVATPVLELFSSWQEYGNQHGHYVGHSNRFSALLVQRGYAKQKNPSTRRAEFVGITVNREGDLKGLTAE